MKVQLNRNAACLIERKLTSPDRLNVSKSTCDDGPTIWDFGAKVAGGLAAGRLLTQICMADLGTVEIVPGSGAMSAWPSVVVSTDQPVAACMASQYAGWQITGDDYFAMGSGPMRAAASKEELFSTIGFQEQPDVAVGVLETSKTPPEEVCQQMAADCGVPPKALTLLYAPTASLAGTIQIVGRSVETSLHKLHELGFDLKQVKSAFGTAPLPPVAKNDMAGIGRTNDAVLYGGQVCLWVDGEDDELNEIGGKVPSSASSDHGRPFADIFASYDHDFYKIDPHLFSPAEMTLMNLKSGRSFRFGKIEPTILEKSFGG